MTKTIFKKDAENNQMNITREFNAAVPLVWTAWTNSELLDEWWAPKPWIAETKRMDFREGGYWLYSMNGPEGERHWARADFEKIVPNERYSAIDSFCDEEGNKTSEIAGMHWKVNFSKTDNGTKVDVLITFHSAKDMETIIEMGFKEGFAAAHDNLDELLESRQ